MCGADQAGNWVTGPPRGPSPSNRSELDLRQSAIALNARLAEMISPVYSRMRHWRLF